MAELSVLEGRYLDYEANRCHCPEDCRDCLPIDDENWTCCGYCQGYDDAYGDAWENSLREERDLE